MATQAAVADGRNEHATAEAIDALRAMFGDRVSTTQAMREQHAASITWHRAELPDVVVFAKNADDVQAVVRICAEKRVPIVPYGTGTSLEGHINAPFGGVSLDLSGLNKIIAINAEDLDCTVEAGVTRKQLNENLRDQGLFFPIDPGADASLGGMASTRASGTNAVRYGTMRENVVRLTAVMPDGSLMSTARRARKTAAGYDLTRLLVGAEGTLGIIVDLTLKLYGIPETIAAGVCAFETLEGACAAAAMTVQAGVPVARIEMLDTLQVRMSNAYSKLSLPETPTLFLEFHGSPAGVAEQAALFRDIAAENGGGAFEWATRAEDRTRLWQARHDAYWSARAWRPGAQALATDVCVPISRLAECVIETRAELDRLGLVGSALGHVGDGNFHISLLVDMDDLKEVVAVKGFLERLVMRAIEMDGTCTGEHGIGQGKMKYLEAELGRPALDAMRAVKRALDPQNIMNPGKILNL